MATTPENPFAPAEKSDNTLPFPQPPAARFREFIAARGLTAHADKAGYQYLTPAQASKLMGRPIISDAVAIPYYDASGQPVLERVVTANGTKQTVDYVRIRLLDTEGQGKYRQPRGTKPHARLSLNCCYDWKRVCGSPEVPVILVEGEFKGDLPNYTVNSKGDPLWLPTISIGGITSWTGKGQNRLMAPELESFDWRGRTVYIAFDYDAGVPRTKRYKTDVSGAIDRLGAMLTSIGAKVQVLHIADTLTSANAGEVKMGLDDLILAGGTLKELLETAEEAGAATALSDVLARYAVFGTDTEVIDLTNGAISSVAGFKLAVAPIFIERGDKSVPVSKIWETHALRRTVRLRGFWPDKDPGLIRVRPQEIPFTESVPKAEDDGLVLVWNDWLPPEGWDVEWTPDGSAGQLITSWRRFVEGIIGTEHAERFHDWVATVAKDPRRKNATCWVVTSPEQGIGKSVLCEVVAQMFGRCGGIAGPGELGSRWNDYLYRKLMVAASEVEDSRAETENAIKNIVTASVVNIERKGRDRFPSENFTNLLISTNRPLAFRVTQDGRREIIIKPPKLSSDAEWKAFVIGEIVAPLVVGTGERDDGAAARAVLLSWYRTGYQITSGYQPHDRAPMTEAKAEAAEQSKSHAEQMAAVLKAELTTIIAKLGGKMAVKSDIGSLWVRKRMAEHGGSGHAWDWMTVIKHLRPSMDGHSLVVRSEGDLMRVSLYSMTPNEFKAMSPSDRATLLDNCAEALIKNTQ